VFSQHEVGGEIVSSPSLEQGMNGRAEFVEKITELTALLRIKWNINHGAEVYGRLSLVDLSSGVIRSLDFAAGSLFGVELDMDQVRAGDSHRPA
jgi:hypothetical protein